MADIDDLRRMVNEIEGDSEYNDDQLEEIIAVEETLEAAAAVVWRQKAAKFAELVDMQEGETRRNLSDLLGNALRMAEEFERQDEKGSPPGGRPTTIGRITRA